LRSDTEDSLRKLYLSVADSNHIVIYCGSGVIKNKIGGVSRDSLVTLVAQKTMLGFAKQYGFKKVSAACTNFFTSKDHTPEFKATIAASYAEKKDKDNTIVSSIGETLYRDSWSEGRLLSELAKFVIKLSVDFKKSVSIVTSNYDTFIEDSIIKELYIPYAKKKEEEEKGKTSAKDFKDFDVDLRLVGYAYGEGDKGVPCYDYAFARNEKLPKIEIHHLHGRICSMVSSYALNNLASNKDVDKEGAGLFIRSGKLVFSEEDYEESHDRSLEVLTNLFSQGTTIIVGSSLTDTPLVRSLLKIKSKSEEQHGKNGGKIVSSRRAVYAFMKCGIDGYEKFQLERAEALGIEPLFYEFHDEIPEVFSNLTALLVRGNKDGSYSEVLPYDQALREWVRLAIRLTNHQKQFRELVESGYEMSAKLARDVIIERYARKDELLKIECWFLDLEGDVSKKVLRVWTNSVGPTFATDLRRSEAVSSLNAEKVASVQAFCEGAPKIIPIDQLKLGLVKLKDDKNISATRWKSFMSVPIVIPFEEYDVDVTVGVVTLASTYKYSDFENRDFFNSKKALDVLKASKNESFMSIYDDPNERRDICDYLKALGIYLAKMIYPESKEN
jgi:hypothetical protein